eukprot:jgi/Tetstr1/453477/TSEL_003969.t1
MARGTSLLAVAVVLLLLAQWACSGDELSDSHAELRVGVEMSHREGTEDTEEYDGPLLCSGECGVQQQAERQGAPATGDGNWAGAGDPMSSIHLSESAIDWGEAHLCSPKLHTLTVTNRGASALHVTGAHADNSQFSTVGFQNVEVPVGGSQELTVEYLPHLLGGVEAKLVVYTSRGSFSVKMRATGVESPYVAFPLYGAKVLKGMADIFDLTLYNPHSEVLTVKEIYADQPFLGLVLPSGGQRLSRGAASKWQVKPAHQKVIMQVDFQAVEVGYFSGRVYIVTDHDTIVIPVSIAAIADGVHAAQSELDFGTLTFAEEMHTVQVVVLNAGLRAVEVLDVVPAVPDPLLGLQFRKGQILEGTTERSVATATYMGAAQGRFSGKLYVVTNESRHAVEVPYRARVLHGTFGFSGKNATFEARKGRVTRHELLITNWFPQPVKIYAANPTDPAFTVDSFPQGRVLAADAHSPPIHLTFTSNSSDLAFTAYLIISTNATLLSIPLKVLHGRLHYTLPPPLGHRLAEPSGSGLHATAAGGAIDFGMIGVNEARALSFNVTNPNPVAIEVGSIESTLPDVRLRLDGVYAESGALLRPKHGGSWDLFSPGGGQPDPQPYPEADDKPAEGEAEGKPDGLLDAHVTDGAPGLRLAGGDGDGDGKAAAAAAAAPWLVSGAAGHSSTVALVLSPGETAAFTAELTAGEERSASGEVVVVTPKERHSIPVLYHSLVGSLNIAPAMVRFEGCYPGMPRTTPLMARSTYTRPLTVTAVTTSDPRLRLVLGNTTIPPGKRVHLGMLEFDAGAAAKQERLAEDSFDQAAAMRLVLDGQLSLADEKTLRAREEAWRLLLHSTGGEVRATVTIHTDVVAGYVLNVRASLQRPSILTSEVLEFHQTEVGDSSLGVIQVTNPSPRPVAVALLEPQFNGRGSEGLSRVDGSTSHGFMPCSMCGPDSAFSNSIKCENCRMSTTGADNFKSGRGAAFRFSPGAVLAAVLQPMQTLRLGPIEFAPQKHHGEFLQAVLPIRNNLTFVEMLEVKGQGLAGELDIRLHDPDNEGPLHLDVTGEMVGLRDGQVLGMDDPGLRWPLWTRFSFYTLNRGNIQLTTTNVYLLPLKGNGADVPSCMVGGFQLQRCGPDGRFWLPPGHNYQYSMVYWPQPHAPRTAVRLVYEAKHGVEEFVITAEVERRVLEVMHSELVLAHADAFYRALVIVGCLLLGIVTVLSVSWVLRFDVGLCAPNYHLEPKPQSEEDRKAAEAETARQYAILHAEHLKAKQQQQHKSQPSKVGKAPVETPAPAGTAAEVALDGVVERGAAQSGSVGSLSASSSSSDTQLTEATPVPAISEDTSVSHEADKSVGQDCFDTADSRATRRRRRKKGSDTAVGEEGGATPRPHQRPPSAVLLEAPSPAIAPATPVSLPHGSPVKLRKHQQEDGDAAEERPAAFAAAATAPPSPPPPAAPPLPPPPPPARASAAATVALDSPATAPVPTAPARVHSFPPIQGSAVNAAAAAAARQAAAAAMSVASRRPPTAPSAKPPVHPAEAGRRITSGTEETGPGATAVARAPGAKRMAHAALLTPLQTSAAPNLGVIMPAGGQQPHSKPASGANSRASPASGTNPTAPHVPGALASPQLGADALSPPAVDGSTPKSARRRRRPRRGGGGGSNPATPVAETPGELAPVCSEWLPAGDNSLLLEELEPESAPHEQLEPDSAPGWGGGGGFSFSQPGVPGMPGLPESLLPLPTPSSAVSGAGTPLPTPGRTLDQLGAAAGIPDSVYSIWGSAAGPGSLVPPAAQLGGGTFQGSLFLDGGPGGSPLPHGLLGGDEGEGEDLLGGGAFPVSYLRPNMLAPAPFGGGFSLFNSRGRPPPAVRAPGGGGTPWGPAGISDDSLADLSGEMDLDEVDDGELPDVGEAGWQ